MDRHRRVTRTLKATRLWLRRKIADAHPFADAIGHASTQSIPGCATRLDVSK